MGVPVWAVPPKALNVWKQCAPCNDHKSGSVVITTAWVGSLNSEPHHWQWAQWVR
ncbi:hypothetical protein FFH90_012255 [Pseudomonas sp. ATCC 43928]|nr:hypothetical protein FFH90_012255 [Pseudomonas sp. ATCC 43928]